MTLWEYFLLTGPIVIIYFTQLTEEKEKEFTLTWTLDALTVSQPYCAQAQLTCEIWNIWLVWVLWVLCSLSTARFLGPGTVESGVLWHGTVAHAQMEAQHGHVKVTKCLLSTKRINPEDSEACWCGFCRSIIHSDTWCLLRHISDLHNQINLDFVHGIDCC